MSDELEYRVVDQLPAGREPRLLVVLCHGYGAPGTDLVPLAAEVLGIRPDLADSVRFIFPAAPLSMDDMGLYGGRAWWHLNVEQFMQATAEGLLQDIARSTPPGIEQASPKLRTLVERLRGQAGLKTSQVVLGGFSQGAMVATDVALRLPEPPAGLVLMSGTLICQEVWTRLAADRGSLPVLQSHGTADPILAFAGGVLLHEMFVDAGLDARMLSFAGPHTIPQAMIGELADLLKQVEPSEP